MINKFYLHSAEKCRLQKKEKKILFRQFFFSFSKTNKVVNIPVFIHKYIVLCLYFVLTFSFSLYLQFATFSSPPQIDHLYEKKNCFLFIFIVIINLIDVVSKNFYPTMPFANTSFGGTYICWRGFL